MSRVMPQDPSRKGCRGFSGAIAVAALASTGMLTSQAALAEEPVYPVVSPLGEDTAEMIDMVPRLDTLSDKTVCLVSNNSFKVDVTMPAIAKALQESHPGLTIVPASEMPRASSRSRWEAMPAEFRSKGCDAVISGNGG